MSINMNELVTGGSVTVEDGLKAKEEFAPARKVAVTLNFSTPEGTDGVAVLDYVAALANGRQAALLHGKAPAAAPATPAAKEPAAEAPKPRGGKKPAEPKVNDKEKLAAAAGLPTGDTVHKAADLDELDAPATPAAKPADDDLGDLLGETAPVPVTDAELGKAAQEKNGKMKGVVGWAPEKIRKLVAEYAGEGKRISDVPAAKRHDFLKALDALK